MYRATVTDDSLKNSLSVSAGLHICMFLLMYFGLPHLIPPLPSHHEPVPFEIVTVAELTNTRIKPEIEEQKPPAPPPQPEQKAAPAPQPTPVAKPEPPKPPEPKADQQAEALKVKPMDKPKPPEPPKPETKPQSDPLASVLKNVAQLKPAPQVKADQQPDAKSQQQASSASAAPSLSSRLKISEEDLLRRQIEQCWSPPVGARNAESLVVQVIIDVAPDRTVANADIVDKMRYNTDSFFRAAADSAVRALRNPRCNPLLLPDGKYEQWKRIDFTFDPRDML
jgi:outer membrane biosynthesis protein TonB